MLLQNGVPNLFSRMPRIAQSELLFWTQYVAEDETSAVGFAITDIFSCLFFKHVLVINSLFTECLFAREVSKLTVDLVACDVTLMFGVLCYFPLRGLYEDYRPTVLKSSPRLNVLHKTTHACLSQIDFKRQFVLLHKNVVMNNKMGQQWREEQMHLLKGKYYANS